MVCRNQKLLATGRLMLGQEIPEAQSARQINGGNQPAKWAWERASAWVIKPCSQIIP